ncbi:hypothetical protein GCM10010297_32890 [Streptomyces malachitofuscus]|nr:hypothetical protein GCM10010297_32890 [Streptomyces malachitofuscus]
MAVIHALLAAGALILAVAMLIAGAPGLALLGLVALLPGSVALGLWQGNRGARVVAILLTIPSVVGALVVFLLLVGPESSRAWFTRDHPGAYEDADEFGDDEGDELPPPRRRVTPR